MCLCLKPLYQFLIQISRKVKHPLLQRTDHNHHYVLCKKQHHQSLLHPSHQLSQTQDHKGFFDQVLADLFSMQPFHALQCYSTLSAVRFLEQHAQWLLQG